MEEFLESCRATSLLAELEDEEELPDAEEEENEEDCDDSEDCEDNYDEEGVSSTEVRNMFGKRKHWDDDHVLKRKFSALIPAFDPRPGRTNTPQTSDLEVPAPSGSPPQPPPTPSSNNTGARLGLVVRGPNLPGVPDVEVELSSPEWTIFRAVQTIIQTAALGSKADRMRRVWEPTYVIVYRELREPREEKPSGEDTGSRRSSCLPQLPMAASTGCSMDEVLSLVRQLYIHQDRDEAEHFLSKKITNKLVTQIQDPLVLSASALPAWAEELTLTSPFLFPFETRQLFFHCTAFGSSRSIVWLQQQREAEQRGRVAEL